MADAAVQFLLENLTHVLVHNSHLIRDASRQIKNLERDLLVFNAFLKDSVEKRRNEDERTKVAVQEIRDVVYQVEDIIDTFANKTMAKKSWFSFLKIFKSPFDLHAIGQLVEEVSGRVKKARDDIGLLPLQDEPKSKQSQNWRRLMKKDVMGLEDKGKNLICRLKTEYEYLDVISLIGMLGLGKTTLAWKVFNDPDIINKFPIRIWLSISQEFSYRGIFLSILKKLTTINQDIDDQNDQDLANLIIKHLDNEVFLIVMDDVWETDHWKRLYDALPLHNNKGKVLITSRNKEVGKYPSRPNPIITLDFLNDDKSWDLLRFEVLRNQPCPPELEIVGRDIAKTCGGLPLAIVIIGGILTTKFEFSDISATEKEWLEVSTRVNTYVHNDPENYMKKLISLSYDRLPYHLRSCFLYLGMFPEDHEILVSKLIRMWIGEGFIPQKDSFTLEETGYEYLKELIQLNLVKSEKLKHDGKVKTCRLHDTLHEFCRIEAENENFIKEIKCIKRIFTPLISDIDKYRRLSIHSNCLEFISSEPVCPNVRSFVCFSKGKFVLSEDHSSNILKAFKYLKVLDVEPFEFTKIAHDMYRLVSTRYMALSCNLSILPSKFCQFCNIQTLIIHTTSHILLVKANIWEMSRLRYFKTNASAILPKPNKTSGHGEELQTLGTISVESCTSKLFDRAFNLKTLGICGKLGLLLEGNVGSFDSLRKMEHIQKLKLINDVHPLPSSEVPLRGLPQHDQFPPGLTSLTLSATFLSWDAMSALAFLKKLEVLKLKENAFIGDNWKAVDGGFQCLQLLHIEGTNLVVWNASSDHYPKLRGLVLRNCEKLIEIPIGMADIKTFKTLELYNCKSATASANAIKEKQKTQPKGSEFVLSIFHPNMSDQS